MSTIKEKSEIAVLQTQMKDVITRLDRIDSKLDNNLNNMLPRSEYNQAHQALVTKIDSLGLRVTANESRGQGVYSSWQILVGFASIVAAIAYVAFNIGRH